MKGIEYTSIPVNLVAGEQKADEYSKLNPVQGVPTLVTDEGRAMTQSMSILEWLEEAYPEPSILPVDPFDRAEVRAAAMVIAADVHPVNNLKVIGKLKTMGHSQEEAVQWMNDWMTRGFHAFSKLIRPDTPFCFGDEPGLADICLIPQLYNAHRWGCDLAPFERLTEIESRCLALDTFATARPEAQPDAT